jgi:hypothetical protein
VIPRRVMARLCCVRALNARTRVQEQVRPWGPSSEAEPARGWRGPSSEAGSARGSVSPRARRTLLEGGALLGRSGGPRGPSRHGLCCVRMFCVRFEVCLCFVFFAGFNQDSPVLKGTLVGVPDSSPRASAGVPVRFPQMLEPADRTLFPPGCKCLSVGPHQRTCGSSPRSPAGV